MAGEWVVAAGVRDQAWHLHTPGWVLGSAAERCTNSAGAIAGAGCASDCGSGGAQPAQRARLDVELTGRCAGQLAGRTDASPVMELSAEAIWLATAAVDMRTGIDGFRCTCNRRWGARRATARPTCSPTAAAPASRWCAGTAPACGCACAGCTTASSSGRRRAKLAGRSAPSSGVGWWPAWIGSDYRHRRRPSGGCDVNCVACKHGICTGKLHGMNLLNDLARTDIDPALLAQVRALFEKQQADGATRCAAGREGLQDHGADARAGLLPAHTLRQGQRSARRRATPAVRGNGRHGPGRDRRGTRRPGAGETEAQAHRPPDAAAATGAHRAPP